MLDSSVSGAGNGNLVDTGSFFYLTLLFTLDLIALYTDSEVFEIFPSESERPAYTLTVQGRTAINWRCTSHEMAGSLVRSLLSVVLRVVLSVRDLVSFDDGDDLRGYPCFFLVLLLLLTLSGVTTDATLRGSLLIGGLRLVPLGLVTLV